MDVRDVGKNIRFARVQRNMTQEALATQIYTTRQTVSNYETGRSRPDVDTLARIADALSVDITALIYGTEDAAARRKKLWALLVAAAVTAVLAGLYLYLDSISGRLFQRGDPAALRALLVLQPVLFFSIAWTVMQACSVFFGVKPLRTKRTVWVHRAVWCVLLLGLAWIAAGFFSARIGVIVIRVFQRRGCVPFAFFCIGVALWLTQPCKIKQKFQSEDNERSLYET